MRRPAASPAFRDITCDSDAGVGPRRGGGGGAGPGPAYRSDRVPGVRPKPVTLEEMGKAEAELREVEKELRAPERRRGVK